jgi:hypothetical protein
MLKTSPESVLTESFIVLSDDGGGSSTAGGRPSKFVAEAGLAGTAI